MPEDLDHLLDRARVNAGRATEDLQDALASWQWGTFSHRDLLVRVGMMQSALVALMNTETAAGLK